MSKDEATNFDADPANNDNLKSLKYRTKLLGNTDADGVNVILKHVTTTVPLKYLSNFCRSLKILLINCKVRLKLAVADNTDANPNNIIFTIKDTKLYVL